MFNFLYKSSARTMDSLVKLLKENNIDLYNSYLNENLLLKNSVGQVIAAYTDLKWNSLIELSDANEKYFCEYENCESVVESSALVKSILHRNQIDFCEFMATLHTIVDSQGQKNGIFIISGSQSSGVMELCLSIARAARFYTYGTEPYVPYSRLTVLFDLFSTHDLCHQINESRSKNTPMLIIGLRESYVTLWKTIMEQCSGIKMMRCYNLNSDKEYTGSSINPACWWSLNNEYERLKKVPANLAKICHEQIEQLVFFMNISHTAKFIDWTPSISGSPPNEHGRDVYKIMQCGQEITCSTCSLQAKLVNDQQVKIESHFWHALFCPFCGTLYANRAMFITHLCDHHVCVCAKEWNTSTIDAFIAQPNLCLSKCSIRFYVHFENRFYFCRKCYTSHANLQKALICYYTHDQSIDWYTNYMIVGRLVFYETLTKDICNRNICILQKYT